MVGELFSASTSQHACVHTTHAYVHIRTCVCTHVGEHMYAEGELLAGERPAAHVEIDGATHARQAIVEIGGHIEGYLQ